MKYNLSKTTPPAMPRLGKDTESVALLLSQASKDTQKPIVSMLFPILGAHVSGAEFMYPDLLWKETSGMMANLVADSGARRGQLSSIVEATCRDFRGHDDEELAKLVERQKMMKTKSYRNASNRIETYDCQRPLLYLCTCKRYRSSPTPPINPPTPPPYESTNHHQPSPLV